MIILIKLTGIQGNIVYNDIDIDKNIRRSFEDCLQDKYGELAINQFGIPVEAPSEIPRILIVSQKFNFQLQISKNMLQVNVPFNLKVDENPVQYLQNTVDGMKTLLILFKEFKAERGIAMKRYVIVVLDEVGTEVLDISTNVEIHEWKLNTFEERGIRVVGHFSYNI